MNKFKFTFSALVVFVCSLVFTSTAEAQVSRTFVSVFGSDSNPCDHPIRPCRNIQAGITKVQAGGEVVVISSGSYQPFTVNKAVTVAAALGEHVGITVPSGDGILINIGSTDAVVLRGLTINGLGGNAGIRIVAGGVLHVEHCVIERMSGEGISIGGGIGGAFIKDTIVRNNSGHGISIGSPSQISLSVVKASIDRCRLENNAHGMIARDNSQVTIRDSISAGNRLRGLYAEAAAAGTTAELNIENCLVTGNGTGNAHGIVSGGGTGISIVRVSNTTVTNNQGGGLFAFPGASLLSRLNNTVEGNTPGDGSFTGTFGPK